MTYRKADHCDYSLPSITSQHLLLEEYLQLEGIDAEQRHLRKEFCSELVELPIKIQKMLLMNQSTDSLKRLIQTLSKFKSPDTGYLYHRDEINLIEKELIRRDTFKQKPLSQREIKMLLNQIYIYLDEGAVMQCTPV